MELGSIPVFDFHSPWVALIQITLFFALPQLVGLVTDKLTNSKIKTWLLAGLTLGGVMLTHLLDIAIADAWATFDWTTLAGLSINWIVAWLLSDVAYRGILKPTGATEAAQDNTAIKVFGPEEKPEEVVVD